MKNIELENLKLKYVKPSQTVVKNYIKKWRKEPGNLTKQEAIEELFTKRYPNNTDINEILWKSALVNSFDNTHVQDFDLIAKNIINIDNIDVLLNKKNTSSEEDAELIERIGKTNGESNRNEYSFATKYCYHHNPEKYFIYDSKVEITLRYYQKKYWKNKEIKDRSLTDYVLFVKVIKAFKKKFSLKGDIDKFLWLKGKEIEKK
jgi:hypothetical protein